MSTEPPAPAVPLKISGTGVASANLKDVLSHPNAVRQLAGVSALRQQAQPVGHLHSNGDFCQDRRITSDVWPVSLYATPTPPVEPVKEADVSDAGLESVEDEGVGFVTLKFKDEEHAEAFIARATRALRGGTPKPPMFDCVADHNPPEPL